jgi:hypothetical protein
MKEKKNMLLQKFSKHFTNSVNSPLQKSLKTTLQLCDLREAKSDFRRYDGSLANGKSARKKKGTRPSGSPFDHNDVHGVIEYSQRQSVAAS